MSIDDLSWKIIIPVSIVALLIIVTSSYLVFSTGSKSTENIDSVPKVIEVYDEDEVLTGATYVFEPFVLNLNDGSGILNLKVAINIFEFQLPPNFKAYIPAYRDQIISIVTAYNANDLLKVDFRVNLKNELLLKLNQVDNNAPEVTRLFFEEFVIR